VNRIYRLVLIYDIFASVFQTELLETITSGARSTEHLMCVEILVGQINDSAGNTGAMITGSFKSVDQISPDKACLNTAAALLKTKNVSGTQYLQTVHDRQRDIQQSQLWLRRAS
jgi:hypothetical protein